MKTRGKTIHIYLPFGDPRSIRYAGMTNGTIRLIEIPRAELQSFEKNEYAEQAGIYFLIENKYDEKPSVYIGQSNDLLARLKQHNKEKDFWERAMVAISLTDNLTAAHIQYLEKIAIQRAIECNRYHLENSTQGSRKTSTQDWIKDDCEDIFDNISMLLSTLNQPIFESLSVNAKSKKQLVFSCVALHCQAKGYYSNEGFVILKNSYIRREPVKSLSSMMKKKLNELLKNNIIEIVDDNRYILKEDYQMGSPSGASQLVSGRPSNGWVEWKLDDGKTLNDIYRNNEINDAKRSEI